MNGVTVAGIDLSLTSTGIAVARNSRIVSVGTVKSTGRKGDDLISRHARLGNLADEIIGRVHVIRPQMVVVENPSYGSRHGSQHDRSGLWWLVVDSMLTEGYPVATVSPQGRAKYGTGKGNASKDAVLAAVVRRYSRDDMLIEGNDVADATLLAAMGSRHMGKPVETWTVPETHLAAMAGAAWPGGRGTA